MKKLFILLLGFMCLGTIKAQEKSPEPPVRFYIDHTRGAQINADFQADQDGDGTTSSGGWASTSAGILIKDQYRVGALFQTSMQGGDETIWQIGVLGEYRIRGSKKIAVPIGVSASYLHSTSDEIEMNLATAMRLGMEIGVGPIVGFVSTSTGVVWAFDGNELEVNIGVGIRYLF